MIKKIFLFILLSQVTFNVFSMQTGSKLTDLHYLLFDNLPIEELESSYLLDSENLDTVTAGLKSLERALKRLDQFGRAPFFMCFLTNNEINLDLVIYLLKQKAPVGPGALDEKYKKRAQSLLGLKDPDDNTILHYAAFYKHLELIEFFCKNCDLKCLHELNKNNTSVVDIIVDTQDQNYINSCSAIFLKYYGVNYQIKYFNKQGEEDAFIKKHCCCEQF